MADEIFKKIALSEQKSILKDFCAGKNTFMCKGEEDFLTYLVPFKMEEEFITCRPHADNQADIKEQEKVLISFIYGNERYYFQSEITLKNLALQIRMPHELFQLQRRKSTRIPIPWDYKGFYNITNYKNRPTLIDGRVLDYGSGGIQVRVTVPDSKLVKGDKVGGILHLGERRPIDITGEIMHIRSIVENGSTFQIYGLKFSLPDKTKETRMLILTMDLHRDIFFKPNF